MENKNINKSSRKGAAQEQRRFSMEENFMKVKTLNDLIYGKLQSLSYLNEDNERFVYAADFNQEKIAAELNIPIATFKRNFKALQTAGFAQKGKVKDLKGKQVSCYYLPYNVCEKYKLIPITTLDYLLQINTQNVIKVYLYLLSKYDWKQKSNEHYFFTKGELIEAIGYSINTKGRDNSAYTMIDYILNDLTLKGLINTRVVYRNNSKGSITPYIELLTVNTVIKGMEKKTEQEQKREQTMLEKTVAASNNKGAFEF